MISYPARLKQTKLKQNAIEVTTVTPCLYVLAGNQTEKECDITWSRYTSYTWEKLWPIASQWDI